MRKGSQRDKWLPSNRTRILCYATLNMPLELENLSRLGLLFIFASLTRGTNKKKFFFFFLSSLCSTRFDSYIFACALGNELLVHTLSATAPQSIAIESRKSQAKFFCALWPSLLALMRLLGGKLSRGKMWN